MSTLTDIEAAVDRLPLPEQEELLRHLTQRIHRRQASPDLQARQQWMLRLHALRAGIGSPTQPRNVTTDQILAELREDRC